MKISVNPWNRSPEVREMRKYHISRTMANTIIDFLDSEKGKAWFAGIAAAIDDRLDETDQRLIPR